MKRFDVIIIGAGAVGNAIAREISKNNIVSVGVLEKEPDTAFGISGRNSGVLHAGFNNKPGSFMAKLCVAGSQGFEKEAQTLGITFKKTGKLVIARFEEDMERVQRLKEQGETNGVKELRIVGKEEIEKRLGYEAGLGALWSGMTGIFDPFEYTVALAEAAVTQGTEYFFGRQVTSLKLQRDKEGLFLIAAGNRVTGEEELYGAKILINSAGLYADEISRMAGIEDYRIFPCRGEYHILDKRHSKPLQIPVYPVPNEREGGLGVHLTPTIHGNIMIGPSAEYLDRESDHEDYGTTLSVMEKLRKEGEELYPGLDRMDCIRSFSGVRPKLVSEEKGGYADFVIEESKKVPGLIQLIGIESPGLTSSLPIGRMVAEIAERILKSKSASRISERREDSLRKSEENRFQAEEQGDEKMLCRCEGITEAEVLRAYDRILKIGAIPTMKGLKNRARVTMGSCQGSFCTGNIIELLQKKRDHDPLSLLLNGFGSGMLEGRVRG